MRKRSAVIVTALLVTASAARAQDTSVATARQLAITGIDAVESGDCDKGAPLLERAEQLHHASVHLQYLARCRAGSGHLVAATEMWRRIIRDGAPDGSSPAVVAALTEAQSELEKTLPRLASTTVRTATDYAGLSLSLDGTPLPSDMVGAPQILDPGEHELAVTAPGYVSFSHRWKLAEGGSAEVVVELAPAAGGAPGEGATGALDTGSGGSSTPSWLAPTGWITGSVGVASLIAGTVTLLTRNNRRDEMAKKCSGPNGECLASAYPTQAKLDSDKSSIEGLTAASNVLLWGGGALLAGGATMIFIASRGSSKEPSAALVVGAPRTAAGLTFRGDW